MRWNAVALLFALVFLASCGESPRQSGARAPAAPVPVKTVAVAPSEWPSTYEAVGTVRARTVASISSKVMGYVREVKVQTGDRVREGQLLVVLDARDLEAQYRQAEAAHREAASAAAEVDSAVAASKASLDLAQVTFQRMKELMDKKSISNQEFDEASARLKGAQANYEMALSKREQLKSRIAQAAEALKAAEVMRGYAELLAPFAGTVTEKKVNQGDLAAPGAPLLTLEREGALRLEAQVDETRVPRIHAGQSVVVTMEALGRTLAGRVAEIVPAVDPASRATIVKIDLPPLPQLRSGVFGRAAFELGTRSVIAAPEGAVVERGQLRSVLVAEDGMAQARLVTLGESRRGQREILSGLNPGDKVIFPIPPGLTDGAKVEVRP